MSEPKQRDPLHGTTLKALLEELLSRHGWEGLAERVPIGCFLYEPSLSSSLKFLRKTPWARAKVEALYVSGLKGAARKQQRNRRRAQRRKLAESPPVERPETLALLWPGDSSPPDAAAVDGFTLERGVNPLAFREVQRSIGFELTEAAWREIRLVKGAMVCASDEDGPVAVAIAEPRPGGWVELGWVAVDPSRRGRGLGSAVCRDLVRLLLSDGHSRIFCSTQDARTQALAIYLDMGFQPVERPEKVERWAEVLRSLGIGAL